MKKSNIKKIVKSVLAAAPKDIDKFAQKIQKMTDDNLHVEAYLEIAKYMKNKHYQTIFKAILTIQNEERSLRQSLAGYRYEIYKEMLQALQKKWPEAYKKIYNAT